MNPLELSRALRIWYAEAGVSQIQIIENFSPSPDPYSSYKITYELLFRPQSLEMLQLEIWLSSEGDLAVGLETRGRIAQRLGTRARKDQFASGHEPMKIELNALQLFLQIVASAKFSISATTLPLLGVIATSAVCTHKTRESLVQAHYPIIHWVKQTPPRNFLAVQLPYKPWQ